MDEPRLDEHDEVVITFEYPTDYGECRYHRRVGSGTFDAVLNQLRDEGVKP